MWKKRLIALAGILSFALIAFITYEVTRLREAPFTSAPSVGVEGRTIVVRFEEHPPWAMLHAIACGVITQGIAVRGGIIKHHNCQVPVPL